VRSTGASSRSTPRRIARRGGMVPERSTRTARAAEVAATDPVPPPASRSSAREAGEACAGESAAFELDALEPRTVPGPRPLEAVRARGTPARPRMIPESPRCRMCARPLGADRAAHAGCQDVPESRNDWPDGSRQVSCLDCGRPFQSASKAQRLCHGCRTGRGPSGR